MKILIILSLWLTLAGVYWALESRSDKLAEPDAGATLDILLDGPDLFIDFDVPAVKLMGFGHAPVNSDEHLALVDAHRLLDSGLMTVPGEAAKCSLTESFATVGHGYDDLCSVGTSPVSSTLANKSVLRNPVVAALPSNGEPTIISARWAWTCEQPERLDSLKVQLFDEFHHLEGLMVTTNGAITAPEPADIQTNSGQPIVIKLKQTGIVESTATQVGELASDANLPSANVARRSHQESRTRQ